MKFGEKYETFFVNRMTKERTPATLTYKRTDWNGWHTDNEGNGL